MDTTFEKSTTVENKLSYDEINRRVSEYVERVMKANEENPNISPAQHEFLRQLTSIRHEIHAHSEPLFWVGFPEEYDEFFIQMNNMLFFEEINLPFPEHIYELYEQIKADRADTSLRKNKRVAKFVFDREILNYEIEKYLRAIDKEKGTQYAPTGKKRRRYQGLYKKTCTRISKSRYLYENVNVQTTTQQRTLDQAVAEAQTATQSNEKISHIKGEDLDL